MAPIISNQVGYNMFDRRAEQKRQIFTACAKHGVGIMTYGSLAFGLLGGIFTADTVFEESDWRSSGLAFGLLLFERDTILHNLKVIDQLKALALDISLSLPQLAVAWVLRAEPVNMALTGCRHPGEIEDNVIGAD